RKHLLDYDDVMNKQREAVYGLRRELLEGKDQREYLTGVTANIVAEQMAKHTPREKHPDEWNVPALRQALKEQFGADAAGVAFDQLNFDDLQAALREHLQAQYNAKEQLLGPDNMRRFERMIMFQILDNLWKDHLLNMDHLKEGIGLRGYGQRDPLIEYKKESFDMFQEMMDTFENDAVRTLFLAQIRTPEEEAEEAERMREYERQMARRRERQARDLHFSGGDGSGTAVQQVIRTAAKVGRNDPCPCGSGKKYKRCHGATEPV
ncbi:MAG: SEC-C metal-binding domain-containing protein, partial [Terriglobales bacterium]